MSHHNDNDQPGRSTKLRDTLLLLTFGLGALGFLIAIDHANWFDLRPASGTAMAMSMASDNAQGNTAVLPQ